ncbi:hypothetical protein [Mucilaginibacter paludis]|nr:hypothetical protein [Mucilaginibacter paludis]
MEIKVYKKEGLRLLPNSFKKIGLMVILVPLIISVMFRIFLPEFGRSVMALLVIDFIIIGLLLIALSKEKIDDERILTIRLKAVLSSFIVAVIYTVVSPLLNPLFGDAIKDINGQLVVFTMLLMYQIWFWLLKRADNEEHA